MTEGLKLHSEEFKIWNQEDGPVGPWYSQRTGLQDPCRYQNPYMFQSLKLNGIVSA